MQQTMKISHQTPNGHPTLEMVEQFIVPQSTSPTTLDALHYVDTHAIGRPVGTMPQYAVTETAEHPACWIVTRKSMLSGVELYKEIENAHQAALDEEAQREAAKCAAILAEIRNDDRKAMAEQDPDYHGPTERTYETTSLALQLSNNEYLYDAARGAIRANRTINEAQQEGNDDANPMNDADALQAYVAGILEDQDTRNPQLALLVALATAATARVDWEDVAAQISEDL
jgi:hypothetical protein